jgi:hypothetical protein
MYTTDLQHHQHPTLHKLPKPLQRKELNLHSVPHCHCARRASGFPCSNLEVSEKLWWGIFCLRAALSCMWAAWLHWGANVHVSYARMYAGTFFPVVLSRAAAAARFHCCARSVRCSSPGELVSCGDWMRLVALCGGCCTEGGMRRGGGGGGCVYES